MSQLMDLNSDQFMQLLTEALRAGPGSPEWRQALQQLGQRGSEADEYRVLVTAREHLESGKDYRSIRAGPGFTRKVLTRIEDEPAGTRRGVPVASFVALGAALLIVAVVAAVGYFLLPGSAPRRTADELDRTYFGQTIVLSTFNGTVGAEWRPIGQLPLDFSEGLRPRASTGALQGGGLVSAVPLPPEQLIALEVSWQILKPSDQLIAQVFVTDQPDFSTDRATSPHELVWLLQGGEEKVVLPSGRVEGGAAAPASSESLVVRIALNRDAATIDSTGRRLWAGPHLLDPERPRYLGVRFLRGADGSDDAVVLRSIRVQRPQKP